MTVSVLGTEYTIVIKSYNEDDAFNRYGSSGYSSYTRKEIVLCDMATYPGWEDEKLDIRNNNMRNVLRHEIIHVFLAESAFPVDSNGTDAMVAWFTKQGPKIWKAWQEAGAI